MNLLPRLSRFHRAGRAGLFRTVALVALAGVSVVPLCAAENVALRTLLSPEEFHRAGLDKLTQEELAFLEERLAQTAPAPVAAATPMVAPVADAPAARAADAAGAGALPQGEAAFGREGQLHAAVEKQQSVPAQVRSRIPGKFTGWEGGAIFRLENGQVWRQVDDSQFAVNLENPVVVIEKGMMGAFFLHVDGYGSRAKVKRVK